jgi:hypothetical protein
MLQQEGQVSKRLMNVFALKLKFLVNKVMFNSIYRLIKDNQQFPKIRMLNEKFAPGFSNDVSQNPFFQQ